MTMGVTRKAAAAQEVEDLRALAAPDPLGAAQVVWVRCIEALNTGRIDDDHAGRRRLGEEHVLARHVDLAAFLGRRPRLLVAGQAQAGRTLQPLDALLGAMLEHEIVGVTVLQ